MIIRNKQITVFEFDRIHTDRGKFRISSNQLTALQQFYGESGVPYFNLIHNGVQFNNYVGILMVGKTIIEILPKADKELNSNDWRNVLIGMLHAVGIFDIHAPSSTFLNIRPNSILELYFELFISNLEYLHRGGLIKKYKNITSNLNALKGSINFSKHINSNTIHKERFYVNCTTYSTEHIYHKILYKTLKLIYRINNNIQLQSRVVLLLLNFPEMPDLKITENTFNQVKYDRKSIKYKNSMEIAKLLLLNYHPDIKVGNNDVLALMFDMNYLWEQFVFHSLLKYKEANITVTAQNTKNFWKPTIGYNSKIKPDIVINKDRDDCVVLDTKWKYIMNNNPSVLDLRQMYVYMKYYNAKRVALLYPSSDSNIKGGFFYNESNTELSKNDCSLISIGVIKNINQWQKLIYEQIINWK